MGNLEHPRTTVPRSITISPPKNAACIATDFIAYTDHPFRYRSRTSILGVASWNS